MLSYFSDPYIQMTACSLILFALAVISLFDTGIILITGMWIGLLFLPLSLVYGVFFNQPWSYLLHLLLATVAFSSFWILLAAIAEKYGRSLKNGEGMIILIMPVTMFPAFFVAAGVTKLFLDLITSF